MILKERKKLILKEKYLQNLQYYKKNIRKFNCTEKEFDCIEFEKFLTDTLAQISQNILYIFFCFRTFFLFFFIFRKKAYILLNGGVVLTLADASVFVCMLTCSLSPKLPF